MNAAVQQIAPSATPSTPAPVAQTFIAGRISSRRRINTQNGPLHLTLVTIPAPDAYSFPATVELRSRATLGEVGEEFRAKCRILGRARSYKAADPETGELRPVRTADVSLEVIEG